MFTATSTRGAAGSVRPVVRLAWRIVLTMTAAAASVSTAAAQDQVIGRDSDAVLALDPPAVAGGVEVHTRDPRQRDRFDSGVPSCTTQSLDVRSSCSIPMPPKPNSSSNPLKSSR
mgnify:CR=1 FL=1